jgi:hypothetical protein
MTGTFPVGLTTEAWLTGRVPHVRPSVRGPKKILSIAFPIGLTKPRVPHISLVFREMWDTTKLNVSYLTTGDPFGNRTGAPSSSQEVLLQLRYGI